MRQIAVIAVGVVALLVGCGKPSQRPTRSREVDHFGQVVAGADRLRVRSGGSCHRDVALETTLCELAGKERVSDFVRRLKVAEFGGECKCCGDPTFEFYRGKKLLVMVSFHHGTHLRWRQGWPGDAYLTDASRDWLLNWLAQRGVTEPKKEVESSRQRRG